MRELRKDPLLGRWVIIATERASRPYDFRWLRSEREPECPYCERGEPDIRSRPSDRPVVSRTAFRAAADPLRPRMSASGDHEVVVESGRHGRAFGELGGRELERVIAYWARRFEAHARNPAVAFAILSKEQGVPEHRGDAAVRHARSEIVTLPVVPKRVAAELESARGHRRKTGRCLFCDLVAEEVHRGSRVVDRDASFVALAPFASHSPYEVTILPARHAPHFGKIRPAERRRLATMLRRVLAALRRALGPRPYYFVLHSAPFGKARGTLPYHWHIDIAPRTFFAAGFEWGGGVYINPVTPETAAETLRGLLAKRGRHRA